MHVAKTLSLSLGKFIIQLRLMRHSPPAARSETLVNLNYTRTLERRFPDLAAFGFKATESNAVELAEFYTAYIPLHHPQCRGAYLRSMLHRLRTRTKDATLKAAATRAIAVSDLADGLPDRSISLRNDPEHGARWENSARDFNTAYGGPLIGQQWGDSDRGKTLIVFFDAHRELLRGKEILHFAPEAHLRTWFLGNREALGIARYVTADGFAPDVDEHHDITSLNAPDASYDLVICHRVMEHVLDDEAGFSELHRVLRPGGLLSFSVPQSPQQAQTVEWALPDGSHDGHVRQYGLDLEQRIARAGFRVELEPWLLRQDLNALRGQGAYPMRIYHGWRD